ncbi:MAG: 1-acyl-sn-glycerol-3-phosphate acyltransferase [Oscillospiraceae bacterium]|nr:1-acyl-sn-glycerol-3-phosphate acyltransferase [Oscillospiraceae bacterium]
MDRIKNHAHYKRQWALLHPLGTLIARLFMHFRAKKENVPGPFLLLSNHLTDQDPILVGSAFRQQMYFVASEHIMRQGFISKLLEFLFSPIMRQKGGNAASTVKGIIRTLRAGCNVALFPEGNRTWDGITGPIPPATAKMARASGAYLVTYRMKGGYFTSPRWGGSRIRKGRMTGSVVGVYSPEQLKAMSSDEVYRTICADLYENAWETQAADPVIYRGKDPAERLETFLFACPECGALHSLKSEGDRINCTKCGASSRYLDTGLLEGAFRFKTLPEWSRWQYEKLDEIIAGCGDDAIFTDDGVEIMEVSMARSGVRLGSGRLRLFRDRLELPGNIVIPGSEISGIAIRGANSCFIGTGDGKVYQLNPKADCCMEKYVEACRKLGYIDIAV